MTPSLYDIKCILIRSCQYDHSICKRLHTTINQYITDNNFSISANNKSNKQSNKLSNKSSNKQQQNQFTNEILDYYINFMTTNTYQYSSCFHISNDWYDVLTIMFQQLTPSEDNLVKLVSVYFEHRDDKQNLIISLLETVLTNTLTIFPTIIFIESLRAHNFSTAEYLIQCTNIDSSCLEETCKYNCVLIIEILLTHGIPITQLALENAAKINNGVIIPLLIENGGQPTVNCLQHVCTNRNISAIRKILQCKIMPTLECFNSLIKNVNMTAYGKNKESLYASDVAIIIDLLVEYGYVLTYKNVLDALDHGCHINNIGRFNLDFDSQFIEKCSLYGFNPYPNIFVKPTQKCLQIECKLKYDQY